MEDDADRVESQSATTAVVRLELRIWVNGAEITVGNGRAPADADARLPSTATPKWIRKRAREAWERARLSQKELAERLGRSQAFVSQVESGTRQVTKRYLNQVLEACGVPSDERGATAAAAKKRPSNHVVGIDPVTYELVYWGSDRDRELGEQYVGWANGRPLGMEYPGDGNVPE